MKFKALLTYFLLFSSMIMVQTSHSQNTQGILADDGTWCWFSDPRAIITNGHIYTGWVKQNGTVEAARFNLESLEIQTNDLYYRLQEDDHNNPAFVESKDGNIMAMYTRHSLKDLFINSFKTSQDTFEFTRPQLLHPVSGDELKKFPKETVTYANPYRLEEESNRIYCFGRWTGYKPNMMWSDDQGLSWTKSKVFITNYPFDPNNRPYVKYFSDGKSRIHMVFTDGHPRVEPTNSVYYAYYEAGSFYKAGGEKICELGTIPFEPKDASRVFQSNEKEGRAWIADIVADKAGNPIILYTRSPKETDHRYWYASFTDGDWVQHEICKAGKWFPQTQEGAVEREPHYFGGMTLHPDKPNVIYISREVNGVFEIERRETKDNGMTWSIEAVTQNSKQDNVRPYVPRGLSAEADEVVLWMENKMYIHYTKYQTSIMYQIRNRKN
ncbi:MAG: BNR repeat-containing protein [Bacteroidia bacterium]|nr:BNR repeat-containing protein [Bacteroidia bacterium]